MKPREFLRQYIEADKAEKLAKADKDKVRKITEKLLRRLKRVGTSIFAVNYTTKESVKINEDEVYEYVKNLCRDEHGYLDEDKFSKYCRQVIDLTKLEEVSKELEMKVLPIPENCYKVSTSPTITVDHKKLAKEDNGLQGNK